MSLQEADLSTYLRFSAQTSQWVAATLQVNSTLTGKTSVARSDSC
jgi:hypothetical protein